MPHSSPRFSVIIVHRDGAEVLLRTLEALMLACGPDDETWVVDNASRDDTVARLRARFPQVQLILNPCNNGFARACNQALARADGRYLLLLNNDARLPPDALNRLEQDFLAAPGAGIIGAQLTDPQGRLQRAHADLPTIADELLPRPLRRRAPTLPGAGLIAVESVVGAALAVRRAALQDVGPLAEVFFFYYEDLEWCRRMLAAGWEVRLDRDLRVVHLKGHSTRPLRVPAQLERLRSRLAYYRTAFTPGAATLLRLHRITVTAIALLFSLAAATLTLGLSAPARHRLRVNGYLVLWLVAGMPRSWGLPDKCPP